jgi:6-phosphogluconolactonase
MNDAAQITLSRRDFISLTALGAIGLTMPRIAGAKDTGQLLYVGTYTENLPSKGIYLLRISRTGALTNLGVAAETTNPSFVTMSPNGRFAYAVNEVEKIEGRPTGGVTAFGRIRSTNLLHTLRRETTGGAAPCYASTDRAGRFLFVANYTGGSFSVFPILSDGGVGAATSFVQHEGKGPDAERQEGPHAHCIIADPANRFGLVADLGLDRVLVYPFDARTGALTTTPAAAGVLAPGAGPRHLAFHPNGRVLYVTNELDSTVTAFRYEPSTGALTPMQTVPAVSEPVTTRNAPADIHIHPSGRFLYMSNRGHNSIAAFAIDATSAELHPLQLIRTGGDWPRNFAIDPTGRFLLVANQRSNDIHVFRIDQRTGRLTATSHGIAMTAPVCIRFLTPLT